LEKLAMKMKNFFLLISFIATILVAMKWVTVPPMTPPLVLIAYAVSTFLLGGVFFFLLLLRRGERSRVGLAADVFYRVL
jgi:hypothetical protein